MIRVLLAGDEPLARGLRDAGVEVVFLDAAARPEQLATIAVQEDVDAVVVATDAVAAVGDCLAAAGAADIPALTPAQGRARLARARSSVGDDDDDGAGPAEPPDR